MDLAFLQDEVRCGFFIPTQVKQAWAATLRVLAEIDRICVKYNIEYFADWGTLLGAIRHGGYVPWDDDLDICMKRKDYQRFLEVAMSELPEGYCLHHYRTKDDYWLFITRVVNAKHICYEEKHLEEYYNFPYLASIDIFVLDYLYEDEQEERVRCTEVKDLLALADWTLTDHCKKEYLSGRLQQLSVKYGVPLDMHDDPVEIARDLYELAERQMGRVEHSSRIGQMFPWILKGDVGTKTLYYDQYIRVPFEQTTIPVPVDYHYILQMRYGDYLKPKKAGAIHTYPFFEAQKAELKKVMGDLIHEYEFQEELTRQACPYDAGRDTASKILIETLTQLDAEYLALSKARQDKRKEESLGILADCQELAIAIGNYVEEMYVNPGLTQDTCIRYTQEYCEAIYAYYQFLVQATEWHTNGEKEVYDSLDRSYHQFVETLNHEILKPRWVAILVDPSGGWMDWQAIYDFEKSQPRTHVIVVSVPAYYKDCVGRIRADKGMLQPMIGEDVSYVVAEKLNITSYHWDRLYAMNPYDGQNGILSIPKDYYSENLCRATPELIYVMRKGISAFTEEDVVDCYGMKYRICQPLAIAADKIIPNLVEMVDLYVDTLCEWAGESTREYWSNKFLQSDSLINSSLYASP